MATFSKQITAQNSDVYEQAGTALVGLGNQFVKVGRIGGAVTMRCGFRFATVNVPKNANITSAFITAQVYQKSNTSANWTGKIWGDDVDDAAAWGASSRPSQITKTTASANLPTTWAAAGANTALAITSIVQEIVNRTGWASGADMRFMFEGTGVTADFQVVYLDAVGTYGTPTPATLKIIYTASAGGVPTIFEFAVG